MIRFGLVLLATSAVVVTVAWLALNQAWIAAYPTYFFRTVILLLVSTLFMYGYLARTESSVFVQLYLLVMVVKLLAYGAYNVLMIMKDPENAVPNVVSFLSIYVLFTGLEVAFLYRKISRS